MRSFPRCPNCNSDALYRYGKSSTGRQRYLCLACNRQFVVGTGRRTVDDRPQCPKCGLPMHIYMRSGNTLRFRCSEYPKCRTYVKQTRKEGR